MPLDLGDNLEQINGDSLNLPSSLGRTPTSRSGRQSSSPPADSNHGAKGPSSGLTLNLPGHHGEEDANKNNSEPPSAPNDGQGHQVGISALLTVSALLVLVGTRWA